MLEPGPGLPPDLADRFPEGDLIAHGARHCLRALAAFRPYPGQIFCTETAARLLDAGLAEEFSLQAVLARHVKGAAARDHEEVRCDASGRRAVQSLHALAAALNRALTKASLGPVFEIESRAIPILAQADEAGVPVDRAGIAELKKSFQREAATISAEIGTSLAAPSLDLENSAQLERALVRAGLPVRSTADSALLKFPDHPVVRVLFLFRKSVQLAQACQDVLDLLGANGRLAGPQDRLLDLLARLPQVLQAPPGRALVIADAEPLPVWIAAAVSGQPALLAAIQQGNNPHALTAAQVLERQPVTPEEQAVGRVVNQTLIHGHSADTLRGELIQSGLASTHDCQGIRKQFFRHYPEIARWHEDCQKRARAKAPEIRTPLGRRRRIPATATTWQRFSSIVSATLRGGADDVIKKTLVTARLPESALICGASPTAAFIECDAADASLVEGAWCEGLRKTFEELYSPEKVGVHGFEP